MRSANHLTLLDKGCIEIVVARNAFATKKIPIIQHAPHSLVAKDQQSLRQPRTVCPRSCVQSALYKRQTLPRPSQRRRGSRMVDLYCSQPPEMNWTVCALVLPPLLVTTVPSAPPPRNTLPSQLLRQSIFVEVAGV